MGFSLPSLPYDFGALEPHIDTLTMQIHHGKHHQAYVNNLNAALEKHADLQSKSADDLIKNLGAVPDDIRTAVRNNGVGMVIATGSFADTAAVTAVVVYGMVGVLGALGFAVWWGRWVSREAAIASGTQS